MEAGRAGAGRCSRRTIRQQGLQQRLPVEPAEGQIRPGLRRPPRQRVGEAGVYIPVGRGGCAAPSRLCQCLLGRHPLEPQPRLTLVARPLAEAEQGGDPIEEPAQAGGPGGVHPLRHHRLQQRPLLGLEGGAGPGRAGMGQRLRSGGRQQSQRHPTRFPGGPLAPRQGQGPQAGQPLDPLRSDPQQFAAP